MDGPAIKRSRPRAWLLVPAAVGVVVGASAVLMAACAVVARRQPQRLNGADMEHGFMKKEETPAVQEAAVEANIPGSAAWWGKAEWRAREYLKGMDVKDKFAMVHGQNDKWPYHRHGYAGYINTQLSLPGYQAAYSGTGGALPLALNDGPQGFNTYEAYPGTATQFPALLAVAASFSPETSRAYAQAVAEEFVAKGANVLLGPDVEVTRAALTGRSFETISGEDPYLGSVLVRPFVQEVQNHGIIVTVKHWLDNNQEIYRQTMNVEVGDRAQHEIYMPVFAAAFEAGAGSVMCSYNKVSGTHACENEKLLKTLLREELGFKGYVVSDWGATHDAYNSAKAGLDVEMVGGPDDIFSKLPDLVQAGKLTQEEVDEKVVRVLTAMYAVGQFDNTFSVPELYVGKNLWDLDKANDQVIGADVTTDAHRGVAMQTIIDSTILLKNDDSTLPLTSAGKKISLVGKHCKQKTDPSYGHGNVYSGGGSGYVGTKNGKVISPLEGIQAHIKDAASIQWSAAASAAAGADVAVVCVSAHSEEGWDRENLTMPEASELVSSVRASSPSTKIVVLAIAPGAVTTEWAADADAVMLMFYPGEQVGVALAKLLVGEASPGGRLPVTFPKVDEQRFTNEQYPGVCPAPNYWCEDLVATFSEGVLVGYRWNDAKKQPAAYPFGFGLTYTNFEFSNFRSECADGRATVSLTVANSGARGGATVPQLYVGFASLKPALRQLRGFQKVQVAAGTTADVTFALDEKDWRYYDESLGNWVSAMAGGEEVTVSIGDSSADLKWHSVLSCGGSAMPISPI